MPTSRTKLGNWGEGLARRMLQGKGYAVLATNYRSRWGEIDIVAQEGNELVFVEVRTRSSSVYGTPEESVTEAKVQRLVATAQDYLQSLGDDSVSWRIDLVSVRTGRIGKLQSIDHLKYAVQL
ncbi:MAG: YraN family protein [Chloroflexi bacterium]|nr:YraN family protein [Chloroflexota bacterium]MDA1219087.1 YraN family protein [Chloroflexota bacterium]